MGLSSGVSSSTLDVRALAFRGDLELRAKLLEDPDVVELATQRIDHPFRPRAYMLRTAARLSPAMSPRTFETLARSAAALGVTASIDLYCEQSAMLNAYVWPPEGDRVVIVVTNQLLERLDDAELSFVLGHELGHVLVGHTQMPHATEDSGVSPLVAMRLLSWGRSAEMSADRFGNDSSLGREQF